MPIYKKESMQPDRLRGIHIPQGPVVAPLEAILPTRLSKRFLKFFRLFHEPQEPSLQGRIHALKSDTESFCHQLESIKAQLHRDEDPEVYTFIEAIIDPLLKEIIMIQSALQSGNAAQQAKAFKKHGEWIERAKVWIQFHSRMHDRQQIIDAVVSHLIGAALTCIDRDVQVIKEYQMHQLGELTISAELYYILEAEMKRGIDPYLIQLKRLKQRPLVISLEGLGLWKNQIDESRQFCFEKALQYIDALIERETPSRYNIEANERLFEVINEITYLEREIRELLEEVEDGDLSDDAQRKMLSDHLRALAEEVRSLGLDLRLDSDLMKRLQNIAKSVVNVQILLVKKYGAVAK